MGTTSLKTKKVQESSSVWDKITTGLGNSFSTLWDRKEEISNDVIASLEGGLNGYRDVRDNAPNRIRVFLKGTMTVTEMGATAGLSGAFFDTYQTSKYALIGFYGKTYIDKSLGTELLKADDLNPYSLKK